MQVMCLHRAAATLAAQSAEVYSIPPPAVTAAVCQQAAPPQVVPHPVHLASNHLQAACRAAKAASTPTYKIQESKTTSTTTASVRPYDEVPTPKGFPAIDLIMSGGPSYLHEYAHKRHTNLGPIFKEKLGGTLEGVFVADAQMM